MSTLAILLVGFSIGVTIALRLQKLFGLRSTIPHSGLNAPVDVYDKIDEAGRRDVIC